MGVFDQLGKIEDAHVKDLGGKLGRCWKCGEIVCVWLVDGWMDGWIDR